MPVVEVQLVMVGWFMCTVCHQIVCIKEITEYLTRCLKETMSP